MGIQRCEGKRFAFLRPRHFPSRHHPHLRPAPGVFDKQHLPFINQSLSLHDRKLQVHPSSISSQRQHACNGLRSLRQNSLPSRSGKRRNNRSAADGGGGESVSGEGGELVEQDKGYTSAPLWHSLQTPDCTCQKKQVICWYD